MATERWARRYLDTPPPTLRGPDRHAHAHTRESALTDRHHRSPRHTRTARPDPQSSQGACHCTPHPQVRIRNHKSASLTPASFAIAGYFSKFDWKTDTSRHFRFREISVENRAPVGTPPPEKKTSARRPPRRVAAGPRGCGSSRPIRAHTTKPTGSKCINVSARLQQAHRRLRIGGAGRDSWCVGGDAEGW